MQKLRSICMLIPAGLTPFTAHPISGRSPFVANCSCSITQQQAL